IAYSVSPRFTLSSIGPKPSEKVSTRTPCQRAIMKWPSSCTKTSTPSTSGKASQLATELNTSSHRQPGRGDPIGQHLILPWLPRSESFANQIAGVRPGRLIDLTNRLKRAHRCRDMRVHALRDHARDLGKAEPPL